MSISPKPKPKVFIGSSTEGLGLARSVQHHLRHVAKADVWEDGCFGQNEGNLEALMRMLDVYDFAVFIFSPDDEVTSRGKVFQCPRDNVLFEFGLFLGALERDKCFVLASDSPNLKLPSDLQVTIQRYDSSRPDNLRAATGAACQLLIDEVTKFGQNTADSQAGEKPITESEPVESEDESLLLRSGLTTGPSAIVLPFRGSPADWFHGERFIKAFPGVRGVEWIEDSAAAIARLEILLQDPLTWVWETEDYGATRQSPIWWWRGGKALPITSFERLTEDSVLMNYQELKVARVAAVNSGVYWQSFVYVECEAQPAIGPQHYSQNDIDDMIHLYGYAYEAFGIYEGNIISRAEYEDGSALIDGRVVRTIGAQHRVRFLSNYNFVIASQSSVTNCREFENYSEQAFGRLLSKSLKFEDFTDQVLSIRRPEFRNPEW